MFDLSNKNEATRIYRDFAPFENHKEFGKITTSGLSYADIVVIKMIEKVEFSDFIKPVKLPSPNAQIVDRYGMIVGYGQTSESSKHTNKPQKGELKIISISKCLLRDAAYNAILSPRSFCAGETQATPCQGDSGGGIFVKNEQTEEFEVFGIASQRLKKAEGCSPNDYAVFVDVSKFVDWIWSGEFGLFF